MKDQKRLTYIVKQFINPNDWPTLRGIIANWEGDTLNLKFFFDQTISENLKENASVLSSEIWAQYSDGYLEDSYIHLNESKPLPSSSYWVYTRPCNKSNSEIP